MPEQRIISVDSQILNSIQLCPRHTQYSFIQNLTTESKAAPLERGDLIHRALEVYYSLKGKCANWNSDVFKEINETQLFRGVHVSSVEELYSIHFLEMIKVAVDYARFSATKMDLPVDEVEETIFQFVEYCKHFQHDEWHPLAVEEVGSKILFENDAFKFLYNFKIDMVAEKGSLICPFDHKTSKRRQEPTSLSNQFIGYLYGLNLNTIIVNKIGFQKTLKPNERFERFPLTVNTARIAEWKSNSIWWMFQLVRLMDAGYFPMNLTSCDKYSGCRYSSLCLSSPESREYKMERDFKIGKKWDVAQLLKEEN